MKSKIYLSTLVLLFYSLLAGGSVDKKEVETFFVLILISAITGAIYLYIKNIIKHHNKEKREQMIREDEQNSTDFDRSVSIGDDRCKLYFDASREKVMIMRIMTEGITKKYVDNFLFPGNELAQYKDGVFYVYEPQSRKLLCGKYAAAEINYNVTLVANHDKNNGISTKEPLKPFFDSLKVQQYIGSIPAESKAIQVLVDECHGLIVVIKDALSINAFNYIKSDYLPKKLSATSALSVKYIGNYMFIMDKFFKVLVIIGETMHKSVNYSDIIEVSYIENGNQLFTKSTGRTVGGAVVGGLLMGGAGAVVGGLSGDTKQNKEVKNMDIKILLRSTESSSCVLHFMDSKTPLKTKEERDKDAYEKFLANANKAKDFLSIIIDDAKRAPQIATVMPQPGTPQQTSVADELAKLAKLKADAILTEEEFQAQKAKLLS